MKNSRHSGFWDALFCGVMTLCLAAVGYCQNPQDPASVSSSTDTAAGDSDTAMSPSMVAAPADVSRNITSAAHSPIRIASSPGKNCLISTDLGMQRLMASSSADDSLVSLSLDTGSLRPLSLASLNALSIDTDDDKIFATTDDQALLVLDRKSLVRIDRIVLPGHCGSLAYVPSCHRVLVTHQTSDEVWDIDSHLHTLVGAVKLIAPASQLVYDSATDKVLALIDDSHQIAVIDPWTMTVVTYWKLATPGHLTTLGIDSGLGVIFCGDDSGTLTTANSQDGEITGTVSTGAPITSTAYDPSAQQIYCLAKSEGQVDVVQIARGGSSLNLGQIATGTGLESAAIIRGSKATQMWVSYSDPHGSYLQCYSMFF